MHEIQSKAAELGINLKADLASTIKNN